MRLKAIKALLVGLFAWTLLWPVLNRPERGTVLYAQTLPSVVKAQWTPNPASENVTQYQVTLDGGAPLTLLATACTATLCTQTVTVAAYGAHTASVVAQNVWLSSDPTATGTSPAATVNFVLSPAPGQPSGSGVKK